MDQKTAIDKIIAEIKDANPAMPQQWFDMELYFNMAFGAGFDLGRKSSSHSKLLIQMDMDGHFIKEFPSSHQAARSLSLNSGNIRRVCSGGAKSTGGFMFKWKNIFDD